MSRISEPMNSRCYWSLIELTHAGRLEFAGMEIAGHHWSRSKILGSKYIEILKFHEIAIPIGSMGLVCFPTFTINSCLPCREIYQSHATIQEALEVVWGLGRFSFSTNLWHVQSEKVWKMVLLFELKGVFLEKWDGKWWTLYALLLIYLFYSK